MKYYLSPRQRQVLQYLAQGHTYQRVAALCGCTVYCIHVHAMAVRVRTGIRDTLDPVECRGWLSRHSGDTVTPYVGQALTRDQQSTLEQLAAGQSYDEIAAAFGISRAGVEKHAARACKRAKIIGHGKNRHAKIVEYVQLTKILQEM